MSKLQRMFTTAHERQHMNVFPRVLCVCSAGMLRSATAAWVLSNAPYNCNTRAAGAVTTYGLILVDEVLLEWADELVFMNVEHEQLVRERFPHYRKRNDRTSLVDLKPVFNLKIPDDYDYRSPELIEKLNFEFSLYEYPPGARTRERLR